MPRRPGRLQRPARVVQPDVDAADHELGDPHVVVLEDEDPAAQLGRAAAGEDRLDHLLAGPVGRMGLAGEDELDRPVRVVDQAGEPVDVGEDQRRPLVGGEAAGEADRQDLGIERLLELRERRRRLAVAGELGQQALPGEDGELALLVQVRLPELAVRDSSDALPEALGVRLAVEVVEVGVEEALEELAHGAADPGRGVDAVRDAEDRRVRPSSSCQVSLAVSAWSLETAFAPFDEAQAEGGHVELARVAVDAAPEAEDLVDRDAARAGAPVALAERPGDAPHEVGVEALVAGRDRRVDREDAGSLDLRPRRRRAACPAATISRARSTSRNAEWPSLRCQTAGAMPSARRARTPPTPRTSSWWRRISRPRT